MSTESISSFFESAYQSLHAFLWAPQDSDEQLLLNEVAKLPSLSFDEARVQKELHALRATWISKRFSQQMYAFTKKDKILLDFLPDLFRVSQQSQAYEKASLAWQKDQPRLFSAKILDIARAMPEVRFASNLQQFNCFQAAKAVNDSFQKLSALKNTEQFEASAQEFVANYSYFVLAMRREMENFVIDSIELLDLVYDKQPIEGIAGGVQLIKKEKLDAEEKRKVDLKLQEFYQQHADNLDIDYRTTLSLVDLVKQDVLENKIVDVQWKHLKEVQPKKLFALVLLKALTLSKKVEDLPVVEAFWARLDREQIASLHKTLYQFQPIHFKVIQFMLVQGGAKHLTDNQIRYLHYISPAWAIRIEWFVEEVIETAKQVAIDEVELSNFLFKNQ